MELDRRELLALGGLGLASCAAKPLPAPAPEEAVGQDVLDAVLEANALVLPEERESGANHYPMAAEALAALGREDAIEDAWRTRAKSYAGEPPREAPIAGGAEGAEAARALGRAERYGDWLDLYRAELAREPWRDVLTRWTPALAPGLSGAAFHGLIRTGHAARALRTRETAARRDELAVGLAYWAARHAVLPVDEGARDEPGELERTLVELDHPDLGEVEDVGFFEVDARLTRAPLAPPIRIDATGADPRAELDELVRVAATAFLEMLVLERHRVWLLHTITAPGTVALLLPDLDDATARSLVACARQAVVAMYAAFGASYTPRAHLRPTPPAWPDLIDRAVHTRSVHTIKLTETLTRFAPTDDVLLRSVATQWLEWT